MFSKKYWVNNIEIDDVKTKYGQRFIGLYRGGLWKGVGNFCGWYAEEYMRGAVLLGYFVIESPLTIEKGKEHIKEVRLTRPKRYRKLYIASLYSQYKISAKNDKEALDLFFAEKWDDKSYAF